MKFVGWISLGAALVCSAWAPSTYAAEPIGEEAGIRLVCARGPESAVARAQRLRGEATVVEAGVLPNPSVVVEHQRALSGPSEQETIVGLAVPLGIGGRRFLLQDAAEARRAQAYSDADATLFESALSFREAFVAAALDRARVAVLEDQQSVLEALSTVIQRLTKGGETAGYDLLRQRTHARLHRRLLDSAKAKARASEALLSAWVGADVSLPAVALGDLAGGNRAAGDAGEGGRRHPRVRSLEAEARAGALEARAARRRWVPDLEVFAGYRATTVASATGHGISASVSLPLTLFDHGQGEVARAEAEREIARSSADSVRRQSQARLAAARVRLRALSASVAEMDKATADAGTLRDKARQLYAAGESTITELLEAFRGAEEARLGAIDLAEEIATARIAVMRAAGSLLDPALDRACSVAQGSPR